MKSFKYILMAASLHLAQSKLGSRWVVNYRRICRSSIMKWELRDGTYKMFNPVLSAKYCSVDMTGTTLTCIWIYYGNQWMESWFNKQVCKFAAKNSESMGVYRYGESVGCCQCHVFKRCPDLRGDSQLLPICMLHNIFFTQMLSSWCVLGARPDTSWWLMHSTSLLCHVCW